MADEKNVEYETIVLGNEVSAQTVAGTNVPETVLSVGDILCETYILRARLGRGGMGEVWKADEVYEGEILRTVVIKTLAPNVQNVQEEMARIQSMFHKIHSLQHQHICPMYAMKNDPKAGTIIVMKYIDGMMLQEYYAKYLRANNEFPVSEVVRLLLPIAQALDYSHSKKVLHRDVKPQNILVSNDESDGVQLIDFGLVMEMRTSMAARSLAQQFDTSGTLPYMSPEQWSGEFQDARADQFSLAVVVYELLAGHLPFTGTNMQLLGFQILNKSPEPILGVPDFVNFALQRALSKNRKMRFEKCEDFIRALEDKRLTQDVMSQAEIKAAAEYTAKKERGTNLVPVLLGGGLVLILILVIGMFFLLKHEQKQIAELIPQMNSQNFPSALRPIDENSLVPPQTQDAGNVPNWEKNQQTFGDGAESVKKAPEMGKDAEIAKQAATAEETPVKPEPKEKPKTEVQPEVKAEPEAETKAEPKVEAETKAEVETKAEAEPKVEAEPKAEVETKAEPEVKTEPETQPETPAGQVVEAKTAETPQAESQAEDPLAQLTPNEILEKARDAAKNKKNEEAFQLFKHLKMEELDDKDLDAYADVCSDLGLDVTATKVREIQMSRNPSREIILESIRDGLEAQNYKNVIEWCEYILKDDPNCVEIQRKQLFAMANLARAIEDAMPARKALEIANRLVEMEPEKSESYADRGFVYMKNPTVFDKAYDFSKKDFEKALSIDPQNIQALLYQGIQLRDVFLKKQAAAKNFQQVIELDPNNAEAQLQMGLLLKVEKPAAAIEYLTNFLKLQPERWDVYEQRGNIYFGLGEDEKALADLNLCLKITPGSFPVVYQRAQVETRLKYWKDAKTDLDFLIENDQEPENQMKYYKTLSEVFDGAGKKRQAQEAREKADKIRVKLF